MIKHFALVCTSVFFLYTFSFSQTNANDPYQVTVNRLGALTQQAERAWRFPADIPHPEDPGVNDGEWGGYEVRNVAPAQGTNEEEWMGTRVFRRWSQIPEKINGYATQGSRVELNLRFTSPDTLMITVFSIGSVLYRGDDDNILPVLLMESAQPGQKFLVAARVVSKDTSRANFERAEIVVDPPESRPNPALLRLEFIAARPFVEVKSDNVIVSAMKKAEDGQALILRFYEWAGKPGSVTFHLPPGAQSARETNLMEKPIADLPLTNSELTVSTKPYEIKTVEIKFAGVPVIGESTQQ